MGEATTVTTTADEIDDEIDVSVPLRAEHAATLRVLAASLGSDVGMSIDEIDDVKLALSEVFTLLVDDADEVGAQRAHVRFNVSPGSIEVTLHRGLDDDELELDVLASTILSSITDSYSATDTNITIVKQASEQNG